MLAKGRTARPRSKPATAQSVVLRRANASSPSLRGSPSASHLSTDSMSGRGPEVNRMVNLSEMESHRALDDLLREGNFRTSQWRR